MPLKAQEVANAIAEELAVGLPHPGNPATKQPATTVVIPMFRTHGKPPPIGDATRATNQVVAEAIIHLIETKLDSTIVSNTELKELKDGHV